MNITAGLGINLVFFGGILPESARVDGKYSKKNIKKKPVVKRVFDFY